MSSHLRVALTADLHRGLQAAGDAATRLLVEFLQRQPPDLLVLAGDIGTQDHFAECLALFDKLPSLKALVPGNHDIWVQANDPRGDSLFLYEQLLPQLSRQHGFHYLDQGPLIIADADLALVGTMNWYDYSWSLERLQATVPRWEFHLTHKLFTRGRHNDANFVRWELSDRQCTERVVTRFGDHLRQALASVSRVIVITHHPCFQGLNYPPRDPIGMDRLLWEAFSGNRAVEELLLKHQDRIPLAFSGHTHYAREGQQGRIRGYNIGGDYHFKRLLVVQWPEGEVEAHEFGTV